MGDRLHSIEVRDISKSFIKEKSIGKLIRHPFKKEIICALNCVSLTVKKGEFFGLLGTNGAGKTTLLKILSTLIIPDSGTVFVNGYDVVNQEADVKRQIGLIHSDERSFFWRLTGKQNLAFFASLYGLEGKAAKEKIDELLTLVDLYDARNSRFDGYSSGMKHRLSIARGLLNNPSILLVDELTTGIDPVGAMKIRDFLKQLSKKMGKTILLTTHDMHEAEELCDRIAILNKGEIKAIGTASEIKKIAKEKTLEKAFKKLVS